MKCLPAPAELMKKYSADSPEQLAVNLGFRVLRLNSSLKMPDVEVNSEYRPEHEIILYNGAKDTEQWHIAHELYHGLAHKYGISQWLISESAADTWADAFDNLVC